MIADEVGLPEIEQKIIRAGRDADDMIKIEFGSYNTYEELLGVLPLKDEKTYKDCMVMTFNYEHTTMHKQKVDCIYLTSTAVFQTKQFYRIYIYNVDEKYYAELEKKRPENPEINDIFRRRTKYAI